MRNLVRNMVWLASAFVVGAFANSLVAQGVSVGRGDLKSLTGYLERDYNLKPRYAPGSKKYFRLWMTIEGFNQGGNLVNRYQWRGDFERVVRSVNASGRAEEQITWKNIGKRTWSLEKQKYDPHEVVVWAEGFTYPYSAEDDYDEVRWDLSSTPRTMEGVSFAAALQPTGHLEYDFLRSTHHAGIERLRRIGQRLTDVPHEGVKFSLNLPPLIPSSVLSKEHIQIGFLGLMHANGEPCAIIDYRQGPQTFSLDLDMGNMQGGNQALPPNSRTDIKSFHYGQLLVRVSDGSLVEGDFTERTVMRMTTNGKLMPFGPLGRGVYQICEISEAEFERGLGGWANEEAPMPNLRHYKKSEAPDAGPLGQALLREYDLKPKYRAGEKSHYRLTVTGNNLDLWGNINQRRQWRGDFQRLIKSVNSQGKAYEEITWRNLGNREGGGLGTKYGTPQAIPWGESFKYRFSAEDGYEVFPWDRYDGIPKTLTGFLFKNLTVSAHFEFDFLRSSRHGAIEKLRKIGDMVRAPDNDQPFAINHAPLISESRFQREDVYTSFLGLTLENGQPCALLDFRQGPQNFSWMRQTESGVIERTEMKSWQYGLLRVRLEDGQLERGDFAEHGILKVTPSGATEGQSVHVLSTFEMERIMPEEFEGGGLKGWAQDQPVHPAGVVWDR